MQYYARTERQYKGAHLAILWLTFTEDNSSAYGFSICIFDCFFWDLLLACIKVE
jgi:hypothetical protein